MRDLTEQIWLGKRFKLNALPMVHIDQYILSLLTTLDFLLTALAGPGNDDNFGFYAEVDCFKVYVVEYLNGQTAVLAIWDYVDGVDVLHFNYARRAQEACVDPLAYSLLFALYGFDFFAVAHMCLTSEEI